MSDSQCNDTIRFEGYNHLCQVKKLDMMVRPIKQIKALHCIRGMQKRTSTYELVDATPCRKLKPIYTHIVPSTIRKHTNA